MQNKDQEQDLRRAGNTRFVVEPNSPDDQDSPETPENPSLSLNAPQSNRIAPQISLNSNFIQRPLSTQFSITNPDQNTDAISNANNSNEDIQINVNVKRGDPLRNSALLVPRIPQKPPTLNIENSNKIVKIPRKQRPNIISKLVHPLARTNSMVEKTTGTPEKSPTKSLNKPNRAASRRIGAPPRTVDDVPQNILAPTSPKKCDLWQLYVSFVTCLLPNILLAKCGVKTKPIQQAWREKIALCSVSAILCALLAFLTFGMQKSICAINTNVTLDLATFKNNGLTVINGVVYNPALILGKQLTPAIAAGIAGLNIYYTPQSSINSNQYCINAGISSQKTLCYTSSGDQTYCDPSYFQYYDAIIRSTKTVLNQNQTVLLWPVVEAQGSSYLVFKTRVFDTNPIFRNKAESLNLLGSTVLDLLSYRVSTAGKDVTLEFAANGDAYRNIAECVSMMYTSGSIDQESFGCLVNEVILYISLIIVLGVVMTRFILAVWFSYFISKKLGNLKKQKLHDDVSMHRKSVHSGSPIRNGNPDPLIIDNRAQSQFGAPKPPSSILPLNPYTSEYTEELYTILLVTCYSEGREGLKATLDSLANTSYNDDFKLLVVICDGIIKGTGNDKSTPEICLDLITLDPGLPEPQPQSYYAVGEGSKRHNMAKVYAGWYNTEGHCVPTLVIVKCGTLEEQPLPKPGNRGKRDSQLILMSFFQKVTFDDVMSPLDIDLFEKMRFLMGVTGDCFEIILMVDADTVVAEDSLSRMIACMYRDTDVIGLCGETRIANKAESFTSMIQVFEYYLSHHLAKAFESVFGGVTCLPGCFCMYRIKAPKPDGYWVPIICNPDIVATYSQNDVDTLHKKNLFLLGEDRFLTTLMLQTFTRRKLIFVPKAYCETTVPAEFRVLLSQRRRWINSTVHNLMELALVRELCGTFCFSMQMVVILELIGTVTLPAAIVFTLLIIGEAIAGNPSIIPLALLGAILGLPAVLIMITSGKPVYFLWMLIYLVSLPIWNFVLPVYAFWHFDDFSWGQTRTVEGDSGHEGHGKSDQQVINKDAIPLKKWVDWNRIRNGSITPNEKTPERHYAGDNVLTTK